MRNQLKNAKTLALHSSKFEALKVRLVVVTT